MLFPPSFIKIIINRWWFLRTVNYFCEPVDYFLKEHQQNLSFEMVWCGEYKRVCNEYTFSEKLITFSAKLFFLFLPFIQKTIAHVKCLKERISVFVNFCYGQNVVVKKVVTYFLSKIDDFPFELVCKKRLYCGLTFNSSLVPKKKWIIFLNRNF